MWYVGKLNWPNKITGGTKPVFDACYQTGLSCAAKNNLTWQSAGDPCVTPCYTNNTFVGSINGAAQGPCP